MESACATAGIESAEALRDLGTDAAYGKMIAAGLRPHFIGYYALEMGLQGRPWNDCQGTEKIALRKRFDAIKAQQQKKKGHSDIEAALDILGVIKRET